MALTLDGTNGIVSSGSITTQSATGVIFSDSSNQGAAASPFSLKNRIINGDMVIDQRNAGASISNNTTGSQFSLDRWLIYGSQASKFTAQQNAGSVTPPAGYTNYLGCTSTSAYTVTSTDEFDVIQRIEGFNTADLAWGTANARTVTMSFWVRSSLTGTFGGAIGNNTLNRMYVFSYTISAANTWEYKTITIAGDTSGTWLTNSGVGIQIYLSIGAGTSVQGTPGVWGSSVRLAPTGQTSVVGTNGATWYITGVQLERNTTATPFEWLPYGLELQLCQRYFEISGATGATSNPNYHGTLYDPTSTLYLGQVQLQVTKRTAPIVTVGAGSTGTVSTIGISSFFFTRNAAAAYLTYWTASAEL